MSSTHAHVVTSIDHKVPHSSTVPAIAGQQTEIFLREKFFDTPQPQQAPVLFVHGAFSPCTVAFDLAYKTYSWMDFLARSGFDTFALDLTGYGNSSRPMMDTPANIDPAVRAAMGLGHLARGEPPSYSFELVTSQSEWDEVGRAIEFICALRNCRKVHLIGWSSGGKRAGGYASLQPDRIDKLVLYACANYEPEGPDAPVRPIPYPGYPMVVQNREVGERQRWSTFLQHPDQVEAGVQDIVWRALMDCDPVGAGWGPGVVRAPTRSYWGWNRRAAKRVSSPTLFIIGDSDRQMAANHALFSDIGAASKVFVTVRQASHFLLWERQHQILFEASREWLASGTFHGREDGRYIASSPTDPLEDGRR